MPVDLRVRARGGYGRAGAGAKAPRADATQRWYRGLVPMWVG